MTIRMQIPDAPKNLWRMMLKKVTDRKGRINRKLFNMGYWHAFEKEFDIEMAETKKEVKCSTIHCMAGWSVVLTPGGLELEDKIRKKLDKGPDFSDALYGDFSSYVQPADSATSITALLILEKAGWNEHVMWRDFIDLTETEAMKLIRKLAKMEGERVRKRRG